MPTSKQQQTNKIDIASFSKPVDHWLDEAKSALVVEMAKGQRLEIPLSADEFEQRRNNGMRVYDGRKDGPEPNEI